MASKNSPSALVSGMGMAMTFLQSLVNEMVRLGGFPEMLHPLSSEHGKAVIAQLASLIVGSPWRVPRTLIEKLVAVKSVELEEGRDVLVTSDTRFHWEIIDLFMTFHIPVIHFDQDLSSEDGPVPPEILKQLRSMEILYPLIVEWENEPHVVVDINVAAQSLEVGQRRKDLWVEFLKLAPAKYFDLDR